ncbi:MAG: matrixin family metalloprotease, partial [Blastocatellia bacterium]|nr:matrixin family metalloprotease [Blastocatellia bacterium]
MKSFRGISGLFVILALVCSVMGSSLLSSTDGVPRQLRWKGDTIKIALSSSLFRTGQIKAGADTRQAIERSLATWEAAANIRFEVTFSDEQNVSPSGPVGDGISLITIAQSAENVLLFGKQAESHPATTRIFYSGSGQISEADIVLNPFQQFSTDGTFGTFDLESTLTHEIGHLLGLDHSAIFGSTMYPNHGKNGVYAMTQFNARTLSISDLSGIRSLYPENVLDLECCGSVVGRLTNSEREPAAGAGLWLE